MASPRLTVKQFAILTLGKTPPWHFGSLLKSSNRFSLSLRESISALSEAQTVVFAWFGSFEQFLAEWDAWVQEYLPGEVPSPEYEEEAWYALLRLAGRSHHKGEITDQQQVYGMIGAGWQTLEALADELTQLGVSLVYVDREWGGSGGTEITLNQIVGIAGTYGVLANLNVASVFSVPPTELTVASLNAAHSRGAGQGQRAPASLLFPLQSSGIFTLSEAPYSALRPATVESVPLGLLALEASESPSALVTQIDIQQLLAQHLYVTWGTMASLLLTINPTAEGLDAAARALSGYGAWLNYLTTLNTVMSGPKPLGQLAAKFPRVTIPQIVLQPADKSQPAITIAPSTLNPDGTITGGTVSQGHQP